MKPVFAFFLFFSSVSFAQTTTDPVVLPTDSATGAVQFQQAVRVDPSMDAQFIMKRALSWFSESYVGTNDVVQQYDPQAGIIIISCQLPMAKTSSYRFINSQAPSTISNIYHMLIIEARSGWYRATMTNFEREAAGVRVPLQANLGTMTEKEYMEGVRRLAAGSSMEKLVIKSAQKNALATLDENRRYMKEFQQKCNSMLEGLKRQMQKKTDW